MPQIKFLSQGIQKLEPEQDTQTHCSCELDLDPITLIYESDLDILKMYLHTKTEVSKLHRHTHIHTIKCITVSHLRVVIRSKSDPCNIISVIFLLPVCVT